MLQERQIVDALGNQIDIQLLGCIKYAIISFHSTVWIFISINVTIYRTVPILQSHQTSSNSHYIIMATKLSSI